MRSSMKGQRTGSADGPKRSPWAAQTTLDCGTVQESECLRPWPKSQPWQGLLWMTSWMAGSVAQTCPPRYHHGTAHWQRSRRPDACSEADAAVQTAQILGTTAKTGRPRALQSHLTQPGRDIATLWLAVDERSGCGRCRQHLRATPHQGGTHLQRIHGAAHHRAETSPGMRLCWSSRPRGMWIRGIPAFCASRRNLHRRKALDAAKAAVSCPVRCCHYYSIPKASRILSLLAAGILKAFSGGLWSPLIRTVDVAALMKRELSERFDVVADALELLARRQENTCVIPKIEPLLCT